MLHTTAARNRSKMKWLRRPSTTVLSSLIYCLVFVCSPAISARSVSIGPISTPEQAAQVVEILRDYDVAFDRDIRAGRESLGFIIVSPVLSGLDEGKELVAELKASGEEDVLFVAVGDYTNRVSAGVYRTERSASRRQEQLNQQGFDFEVVERGRRVEQIWLLAERLPQAAVTDLQALDIPGFELEPTEPVIAVTDPADEVDVLPTAPSPEPDTSIAEEEGEPAEEIPSEPEPIEAAPEPTPVVPETPAAEESVTTPTGQPSLPAVDTSTVTTSPEDADSSNLQMMLLLGLFFILISALSYFVYLYYFSRTRVPSADTNNKSITDLVPGALNSVSEGLLVLDNDLNIVMANEPFTRIAKRSADDLTGAGVEVLEFASAEGAELRHFEMPWYKVRDEGKPRMDERLRLKFGDNEYAALISNSSPILADQNRVAGILVSFKDISELERKEQQLEQLQQEIVEERIATTGQLQEKLPEPINALGLLANSLSQGEFPDRDDSRQWLASLYEAGSDTLNTLADLLTYSQADADLIHPQPLAFSATSFVDQIREELAAAKQVELQPDLEPGLIVTDPRLLLRAIHLAHQVKVQLVSSYVLQLRSSESELQLQFGASDQSYKAVSERMTEIEPGALSPIATLCLALAARISHLLEGRLEMSDDSCLKITVPVRLTPTQQLLLPNGQSVADLEAHAASLEQKASLLEQQTAALEQQASALESHNAALEEQSAALEQQTNALEAQTSELEQQAASLEEQAATLEQQATSLEVEKQQLQQSNSELQSTLNTLEQQLGDAVAAREASEAARSSLLQENESAAQRLTEAEQRAGQASEALAAEQASREAIEQQITALRGQFEQELAAKESLIEIETTRLREAQAADATRKEAEIQAELERLNAERDQAIRHREQELQQLMEARATADDEIQNLSTAAQQAGEQVNVLSVEVDGLRQQLNESNEALERAREEQANLEQSYQSRLSELEFRLIEEQKQAEAQLHEHQAQLTASNEQLQSLQHAIANLEQQLGEREASNEEAVASAQGQVESLSGELQAALAAANAASSQRDQLQQETAEKIGSLEQTIASLQQDIAEAEARETPTEELSEQISELNQALAGLQMQHEAAQEELQAARDAREEEQAQLSELRTTLREAQEKLEVAETQQSLAESQSAKEVSELIDELNAARAAADKEASERHELEQESSQQIQALQEQLETLRTSHFAEMQERAEQDSQASQQLSMNSEALAAAREQLSQLEEEKASLEDLAKRRAETLVKTADQLKVSAKRERGLKAEIIRLRKVVAEAEANQQIAEDPSSPEQAEIRRLRRIIERYEAQAEAAQAEAAPTPAPVPEPEEAVAPAPAEIEKTEAAEEETTAEPETTETEEVETPAEPEPATGTDQAVLRKHAINFYVRLQHQVNIMRSATFEDNLMEVLAITHWARDEAKKLELSSLLDMTMDMESALRHRDRSRITGIIDKMDVEASDLLREAKRQDAPAAEHAEEHPHLAPVVYQFTDANKAELAENFVLTLGTNLLEMELDLKEQALAAFKKQNKWVSRYSSILGINEVQEISEALAEGIEASDWDVLGTRLEELKSLYSRIEIEGP